jgi:hypothetical protein
LKDATSFQFYWLQLMAVEDINYNNSIENILTGIAKGVGVEIKNNSNSRRESNSFRERMKERQRKNKMKRKV